MSPEQRINIEPLEVKNLPTANRNISNILAVGAGLTKQDAIEGGNGAVRLRLNGLGGSSMSITANGTDASGNAGSRQLSQYNGISKIDVVSIESVGEVQIVKGVIPAEYGMAMAGNLNIITKSGTNAPHGSLFHRYEGDALSARAPLLKVEPPSTWNQYGGLYGGPLVRDKAFFFAAFEGYRQSTSIPLSANVPTPLFRQIALGALQFPETRLWLDQYPAPTEPFGPRGADRHLHRPRREREQGRARRPAGRLPAARRQPVRDVHGRASVPGAGERAARPDARLEQPDAPD